MRGPWTLRGAGPSKPPGTGEPRASCSHRNHGQRTQPSDCFHQTFSRHCGVFLPFQKFLQSLIYNWLKFWENVEGVNFRNASVCFQSPPSPWSAQSTAGSTWFSSVSALHRDSSDLSCRPFGHEHLTRNEPLKMTCGSMSVCLPRSRARCGREAGGPQRVLTA